VIRTFGDLDDRSAGLLIRRRPLENVVSARRRAARESCSSAGVSERLLLVLGPGLIRSLAGNQRLQTKNREMVANTHNPTSAIADDTPTDADVMDRRGASKYRQDPHRTSFRRDARIGAR
jgi:hypothetical protein